MKKNKEISVIILASGMSSRMQSHKTELAFDDKKNFIQKITEEYINFGCDKVIAVLNEKNYQSLQSKNIELNKKVKPVINEHPEKGRFYSLYKGIVKLNENTSVFMQNIDNPVVNQNILKLLYSNSGKADYIIPSYQKKGGHPVLLSKYLIKEIKNAEHTNFHIKEFLNQYKKVYVETDDKNILLNINTISDYHLYF